MHIAPSAAAAEYRQQLQQSFSISVVCLGSDSATCDKRLGGSSASALVRLGSYSATCDKHLGINSALQQHVPQRFPLKQRHFSITSTATASASSVNNNVSDSTACICSSGLTFSVRDMCRCGSVHQRQRQHCESIFRSNSFLSSSATAMTIVNSSVIIGSSSGF